MLVLKDPSACSAGAWPFSDFQLQSLGELTKLLRRSLERSLDDDQRVNRMCYERRCKFHDNQHCVTVAIAVQG